ncbi:MAG: TolC family protein, partial [Gemmatimonadaceae bacterium]
MGGSLGSTATGLGPLRDGAASRYVVGPTISWPFLDLGRTRARVDVSRASEEEARQTYRATSLRALSEVSSALSTYAGARARLASLGDAAAASERAATLARLRFTEGVSDFLQVLD